jgi:hypothetical protein
MTKPVQMPAPTFTLEALQALITSDPKVRELLASIARTAIPQSEKTDMAALAVRAFKKKGFGTVVPHQDVKTFDRWLMEGRRVKQGETSVRVKSLRLFHVSQTEPMTAKDKKEAIAALEAKRAAKAGGKQSAESPEPVQKAKPSKAQKGQPQPTA